MLPIFINGLWQQSQATTPIEVRNPATFDVLGVIAECRDADVEFAVTAARRAAPAWHSLAPAERARRLGAIDTALEPRLPALTTLVTAEAGCPLSESRDLLARVAGAYAGPASTAADLATARVVAGAAGGGQVVAVLAPTTASLLVWSLLVERVLALGDTVVVLAATGYALSTLNIAECFSSLPPGVFNVLTGGEITRRAILTHPGIDAVHCAADAADLAVIRTDARAAVTNLDLEERAPGPFVICRDADLDRAVDAVAWTCLHDAGQSYAACKHLYVDRQIAGDFTTRLHQYVGLLEIDDPAVASADIGPLRSLSAAKRVEDQVMDALRDRAFPILGGRRFRPSGLPGHFFQPTILSGVPPDSKTGRARLYGPVMLVTPVEDLAQALRLCSDGPASPAAAVLTADVPGAARALAALPTGRYSVNDPHGGAARTWPAPVPAGAILTANEIAAKPWWFPYASRTIV